jgi:putative transposase
VLSALTSSRYAQLSPKQLVPQLADEGVYLASESTIYRLQRRHGLRRTRRPMSRTHVTRSSTVHRASAPNKVWSWDITTTCSHHIVQENASAMKSCAYVASQPVQLP